MDDFAQFLLAKKLFDNLTLDEVNMQGGQGEPIYYKLLKRFPEMENRIWAALSDYLQIDLLDIHSIKPDPSLSKLIPIRIAHEYSIVPIAFNGHTLNIAIADPAQFDKSEEYALILSRNAEIKGQFGTGLAIQPHLVRPYDIAILTKSIYGFGAEMIQDILPDETPQSGRITADRARIASDGSIQLLNQNQRHLHSITGQPEEDAAIIRYVNQLLMEAIRIGASDIHIEPFEDQLRIRYRVDGMLQIEPTPDNIKNLEPAIISRLKIMSNLDIAEKRLPQDGQIRLQIYGRPIDIRVSILPTMFGQGIALRILDRQMSFIKLDQLGMQPDYLGVFRQVLNISHGIILVTGPTGCGKTTTLYAVLNEIDHEFRKVITVEDPIEYQLEGVSQIQVNNAINLSFANILRNILRHDPDIIMVGEIRDRETAQISVSAAMTGHLVLSTLHTNDAPSAPVRLMEMGVEPYLVASSLEAVLAQRLIRLLCKKCLKPMGKDKSIPKEVKEELASKILYAESGCPECRFTGFKGRSAIFEMFTIGPTIKQMLIERANAAQIKQQAMADGMRTLYRSGLIRAGMGVTSLSEIYRVARDESVNMKEFMVNGTKKTDN